MATNLGIQIDFKHIYRPHLKLEDIELAWISLAMSHHQYNIQATAKSLGISRATLYRKMGDINAANKKQNSTRSYR